MTQEGASLQWLVAEVITVVPCNARKPWSLWGMGRTLPEASRRRVREEDTRMRRLGGADHPARMEEALRPTLIQLVSVDSRSVPLKWCS